MRRLPRTVLLLALLLGPGLHAAIPASREGVEEKDFYARWLDTVWYLISPEETALFEGLESDLPREVFLHRFWAARDPRYLEQWWNKFQLTRQEYEDLDGDRARVMLAAGKPDDVLRMGGCHGTVRQLEVWSYRPWQIEVQTGQRPENRLYILFYLEGDPDRGTFRHWNPDDGLGPLLYGEEPLDETGAPWTVESLLPFAELKGCFRWHPRGQRVVEAALERALSPAALRALLVPSPPDGAWLTAFESALREAPESLRLATRSLEVDFLGSYLRSTAVRGRIAVPFAAVGRNAEGDLFDRFVLRGEVRDGERIADRFTYTHHLAGASPGEAGEAASFALDFFRILRPGRYTLDLRLEDSRGLALLKETRPLEVPRLEAKAENPKGYSRDLAYLGKGEVALMTTFPAIDLIPPEAALLVGAVEIPLSTTGGDVDHVDFLLDGTVVHSDGEPPFVAPLTLEETPTAHRLQAVAYDAAGRVVAQDSLHLNESAGRFAVRILSPLKSILPAALPGSLLRVAVETPADDPLAQLELFANDRRLATLTRPPFEYPLPEDPIWPTTFVRAVATLASGASLEALVVLDGKVPVEAVDVQLVELYASVVDGRNRLMTGLGREDFRIFEEGAPQPLERFAAVADLPIRVALLMDTSASMGRRMEVAIESAQRFFRTVVTEKDRAALLHFNHDIRLVVPFTAEVDRLRYGAGTLDAHGSTRLYDALVYTTHYFGGIEGRRALVLLSDGEDVGSDTGFELALERALRARLTVYAIALKVEDSTTRQRLQQLARETGGRLFLIEKVQQLGDVYDQIERELRSQYLLVYRPAEPRRPGEEFRPVRVEVLRDGLTARTVQGYYP